MPLIYFHSTCVEALALKLLENYIQEKNSTHFKDFIIVVPHTTFQTWLVYYLTKNLQNNNGIIANIQFTTLEDSLKKFIQDSHSNNQTSIQDITYKSLNEMQAAIYYYLNENPSIFQELVGSNSSLENNTKKNFQLSQRLSYLFYQYELNHKTWIQEWWNEKKKNSTANKSKNIYYNLQKKIYQELFLPPTNNPKPITTNQWFYDSLGILSFRDESKNKKNHSNFPIEPKGIHLFCLSYIATGYLDILMQLSENYKHKIYFYQLEPETLNSNSPVFSSWIRPYIIINEYLNENFNNKFSKIQVENNKKINKPKGLNDLQNRTSSSIHHKKNIHLKTSNTANKDYSVRFWSAPSIYREVEAVYNDILYKLENDNTLIYEDFAIVVTDIDSYQSAFDWIFNGGLIIQSRSPNSQNIELKQVTIPYSISELDARNTSYLYQALQELWDISAKERIGISSIIKLIKNPVLFQKISIEEKEDIIQQIESLGIQYDDNSNSIEDPYNLNYGLLRSRLSLLLTSEYSWSEFSIPILPYLSENETYSLTSFYNLILELKNICKYYLSHKPWTHDNLYEFSYKLFDILDLSSQEIYFFQKWQAGLLNWEMDKTLENQVNPFQLISLITNNIFKKINVNQGLHLKNGVNIGTAIQLRSVPFRHIYYLGLGEGTLSKNLDQSVFNLLYHYSSLKQQNSSCSSSNKSIKIFKYYLSSKEINQSLLWDILQSAKESITFSYVGMDLLKDRNLEPCSEYYLLMEESGFQKPTYIPIHGYSLKYNHTNSELKEGLVSYDFSKAWIQNPSIRDQFLNQFSNPESSLSSINNININQPILKPYIHLNELSQFLTNPMEYYIKKIIGINEDSEELEEWKDEEKFYLDNLSKINILKELYSTFFHLLSNNNLIHFPLNSEELVNILKKDYEILFQKKLRSAEFPNKSFHKRQELDILNEFSLGITNCFLILFTINDNIKKFSFYETVVLGETGIRKPNLKKINNLKIDNYDILHEWNYGIFTKDNYCILIYPKKIEIKFIKSYSKDFYFRNFFQDSANLFLTLIIFKILEIPLLVINFPFTFQDTINLFSTSMEILSTVKKSNIPKLNLYHFTMDKKNAEDYLVKLVKKFISNEFIHFCPNHFMLYMARALNVNNLLGLQEKLPQLDNQCFQEFIKNSLENSKDLLPNLIQFCYRADDILENLTLDFAKEFYIPYVNLEEI